jgi:hypothetical protein
MRGFPKHLNTRQDVDYCLTHYPEETKTFLKRKLADVKQWMVIEKLKDGDNGKTDEQHKIVEITDEVSGKAIEHYQYEYKDDPNCQLFKLGLTVAEAIHTTKIKSRR